MTRSFLIPGFRFHPTDVELVMFYLKRKLMGKKINVNAVAEVNIYDFSPWDLPDKSSLKSGDLEWYFFCPKARKYLNGGRFNRATETGFWKATGKDRNVKYNERTVATIKTLIFHLGHAGNGQRTNWVMHEYKMEDEQLARAGIVQDAYALCKIFEKSGSGPKNGAQYGAPFNEEEWDDDDDDDLASCFDSQAIVGLVGASNSTGHKQKGPAATSMTETGSSVVMVSANKPTNKLDYKQKGPATMNMTVSQTTRGSCVTEAGSSSVTLPANAMPVDNEDVMYLEDIDVIMGAANGEKVKTMDADEEDGIYDDLKNIYNLEDLKTDEVEYTLDELLRPYDESDSNLINLEDFKTDGGDHYTIDDELLGPDDE